jgi:hypothetical protein
VQGKFFGKRFSAQIGNKIVDDAVSRQRQARQAQCRQLYGFPPNRRGSGAVFEHVVPQIQPRQFSFVSRNLLAQGRHPLRVALLIMLRILPRQSHGAGDRSANS